MNDFIKVIKKDPQVQIKMKDILVKFNKLSYNYQPKIGYSTLIKNVNLKKIIKIMPITLVDIDIELKMKINRLKCSESRLIWKK